jgi:phage gp37-like protein
LKKAREALAITLGRSEHNAETVQEVVDELEQLKDAWIACVANIAADSETAEAEMADGEPIAAARRTAGVARMAVGAAKEMKELLKMLKGQARGLDDAAAGARASGSDVKALRQEVERALKEELKKVAELVLLCPTAEVDALKKVREALAITLGASEQDAEAPEEAVDKLKQLVEAWTACVLNIAAESQKAEAEMKEGEPIMAAQRAAGVARMAMGAAKEMKELLKMLKEKAKAADATMSESKTLAKAVGNAIDDLQKQLCSECISRCIGGLTDVAELTRVREELKSNLDEFSSAGSGASYGEIAEKIAVRI